MIFYSMMSSKYLIFFSYRTEACSAKNSHGDINDCMMEMLAAWLQRYDNVSQKGLPSWTMLKTALEEIEEKQLANKITV